MHFSAYETGKLFLNFYGKVGDDLLEVGSQNVNGSLRDSVSFLNLWVGVDIEAGEGVDIVLEDPNKFPFEDETFDLIVSTSAFEHNQFFWKTLAEMGRVLKTNGYMYICAPSNGMFHRFPTDIFRFYPDAGMAFVNWLNENSTEFYLVESFVAEQNQDRWNDFVCVISKGMTEQHSYLSEKIDCRNVWQKNSFLEGTFEEDVEDIRNHVMLISERDHLISERDHLISERDHLISERDHLISERDHLKLKLLEVHSSRSWRFLAVYRYIRTTMTGTCLLISTYLGRLRR